MSAAAVGLAVLAAVIHAVWNVMMKRAAYAGPAFIAVTNALAYTLTLRQGYRVAALSVIYPVARGSGPVRLAGCAAMVTGVALLAAG